MYILSNLYGGEQQFVGAAGGCRAGRDHKLHGVDFGFVAAAACTERSSRRNSVAHTVTSPRSWPAAPLEKLEGSRWAYIRTSMYASMWQVPRAGSRARRWLCAVLKWSGASRLEFWKDQNARAWRIQREARNVGRYVLGNVAL